MLKRLFAVLFFALILVPFCAGTDLSDALVSGKFWKMSEAEFRRLFSGTRYATVDENTRRVLKNSGLTFGALKLGEILVTRDAETGAYAKLDAVIYSKGDDGTLGRENFEKLLEESVAAIDAATGAAGTPFQTAKRETGVKTRAWKWELPMCFVRLEAAASGRGAAFTSEFVRVSIGPSEDSVERGGAADSVSRRDLKNNVVRDADGNVRIDGIPMVDQGSKGYCAPAAVSRVFAYYGMDGVDQHALAALCETRAQGGTSNSAMEKALEDISSAFRMRVIALDANGVRNYIAEYNKAAKKLKRPLVTGTDMGKMTFEAEVAREAFAGKPVQMRKWLAVVRKNIDAGVPVIWSVRLGLFPEPESPQSRGGHMRLIIGYNEKTGTVFFSDSWGARHAVKEMPISQACAITVSRYVLRPKG